MGTYLKLKQAIAAINRFVFWNSDALLFFTPAELPGYSLKTSCQKGPAGGLLIAIKVKPASITGALISKGIFIDLWGLKKLLSLSP